ncbi:hypothetical protein [Streptomyces sp. NBC_01483]|uniref:hypothetical protein n=1 Tax=Streptomyces sp. NBC_01483 TaxID=2903883 RepID=UPI002E35C38D|nr:hypothetical protein [Streptomyces sp. NBC_01483]
MIRIIRTATLRDLQTSAAATAQARQEADRLAGEADNWHSRYDEADAAHERVMKDLGQALADRIKAERERNEARTQREQDKAETDRQMAELREDFTRLRDAAADTETGETMRAALAYRVLRDLYADAWAQGLLPKRPFDVIAAVMGFDTPQPQPVTAATN